MLILEIYTVPFPLGGWSGGAMVQGRQGPTVLVVGAGGGCLETSNLIYPFLSSFSLSLGDGPI